MKTTAPGSPDPFKVSDQAGDHFFSYDRRICCSQSTRSLNQHLKGNLPLMQISIRSSLYKWLQMGRSSKLSKFQTALKW